MTQLRAGLVRRSLLQTESLLRCSSLQTTLGSRNSRLARVKEYFEWNSVMSTPQPQPSASNCHGSNETGLRSESASASKAFCASDSKSASLFSTAKTPMTRSDEATRLPESAQQNHAGKPHEEPLHFLQQGSGSQEISSLKSPHILKMSQQCSELRTASLWRHSFLPAFLDRNQST